MIYRTTSRWERNDQPGSSFTNEWMRQFFQWPEFWHCCSIPSIAAWLFVFIPDDKLKKTFLLTQPPLWCHDSLSHQRCCPCWSQSSIARGHHGKWQSVLMQALSASKHPCEYLPGQYLIAHMNSYFGLQFYKHQSCPPSSSWLYKIVHYHIQIVNWDLVLDDLSPINPKSSIILLLWKSFHCMISFLLYWTCFPVRRPNDDCTAEFAYKNTR